MSQLEHVSVPSMSPERFASVLGMREYAGLTDLIASANRELHGRAIWSINSTSRGGGVAEMLRSLLAYARGGGVDARWVVIEGDKEFFRITKRLHNNLHGDPGDGGDLGQSERVHYERTLADNAQELVGLIRPQDLVLLHDPQTAGLAQAIKRTGARVIWRAHVGRDHPDDTARRAWSFLGPYVRLVDAFVFSRRAFVWNGLDDSRVAIIPPSIDAFSPKNQDLSPEHAIAILITAGLMADGRGDHDPMFTRSDGSPGRVDRRAAILQHSPLTPADRVVTQISRWDRLKDPIGVLHGFARHVAPRCAGHLVLAGPDVSSVSDDPEGAQVWAEVGRAWRELPEESRRRIHLACLPMEDSAENAAIVNALQRHAEVVVQKSIAEGFGLTVAEAMWKARPVVASRVGGIQDQVVDGKSGLLVDDPHDLWAFGDAVCCLLENPALAQRIGLAAKDRVRKNYLGPRHLSQYFELFLQILDPDSPSRPHPSRSTQNEEMIV